MIGMLIYWNNYYIDYFSSTTNLFLQYFYYNILPILYKLHKGKQIITQKTR